MKSYFYFLFFLALHSLVSCISPDSHYPVALQRADSLAMIKPRQAIAILDSLAPSLSDADESVRRYHALLSIKARDKANMPHKSDSLILALLDYYKGGGDPSLLPEAYYYAGRVTSDLGNAPQALDYFQKAQDAINSLGDNTDKYLRLKSVICSQIAYLLRQQHLHSEALQYFREGFACDSLLKDTLSMSIDMCDIAQIMQHECKYQESLAAIAIAKEYARLQHDTIRFYSALCQEVFTLFRMGDYAKADEVFFGNPHKIEKWNESYSNLFHGVLYASRHNADSARYYYKKVLDNGTLQQKLQANLWLADDALKRGSPDHAITYLKAQIGLADSVAKQDGAETIGLIHSLYNYQHHERKSHELQQTNDRYRFSLIIIGVSSVLLIIIVALLILTASQTKKRNERRYKQMKLLLELSRQESCNEKQSRESQNSKWEGSEAHALIVQKIRDGKSLTADNWQIIESQLHIFDPSFLSKLNSLDLSQIEWQVTILIRLHIQPSKIALLVCRQDSSISSIRQRLYFKVKGEKGSSSDWDKFVQNL